MGCPISPAALLVQQARQAESQDLLSDTEDDVRTVTRAAGPLKSWLEDDIETSSEASSDSGENSLRCSHPAHLRGSLSSALQVQLHHQQQVQLQHMLGRLSCKVQQIDLDEEWQLDTIVGKFAERQQELVAEDCYLQAQLEQQRDLKLQALQHEHSTKAQATQQAQESIQSQERERQQQQQERQELQQKQLEAQRKQQEELVRQQQEHQRHHAQQQQQIQQQVSQQKQEQLGQQQEDQQQQQASKVPEQQQHQQPQPQQPDQSQGIAAPLQAQAQQPTQPAQPSSGAQDVAKLQQPTAVDPRSLLRVSESAAAEAVRYREALQKAEEDVSSYTSDDSRKKERRDIDKQLLQLVQQVSGTKEKVNLKSEGILRLLSQLTGVQITFAYLQLTRKLLISCENQIAPNPKSCFPFAEVTAAVAAHHPGFAAILIGKLHEVCPLSVPKCYLAVKGAQKQYHKLMRFQEGQDLKTGKVSFEKVEPYMRRNSGFIAFHAALMQSDRPGNPVGLDSAWKYLARLLNSLPANRATGSAMVAFLQTAGYRLWMVYQSQFIKLLKYTFDHFLPKLTQFDDSDAKAIAARLGQYINQHLYRRVPDGQQLPTHDESTDAGLYT